MPCHAPLCPAALALLALAVLPSALLLLPSVPPAPKRHGQPPCPWPGSRSYCQPQTRNPKGEMGPISPPMLYACPGPQPQNIIHTVFASRRDPGMSTPGLFPPKNFTSKNPAG